MTYFTRDSPSLHSSPILLRWYSFISPTSGETHERSERQWARPWRTVADGKRGRPKKFVLQRLDVIVGFDEIWTHKLFPCLFQYFHLYSWKPVKLRIYGQIQSEKFKSYNSKIWILWGVLGDSVVKKSAHGLSWRESSQTWGLLPSLKTNSKALHLKMDGCKAIHPLLSVKVSADFCRYELK